MWFVLILTWPVHRGLSIALPLCSDTKPCDNFAKIVSLLGLGGELQTPSQQTSLLFKVEAEICSCLLVTKNHFEPRKVSVEPQGRCAVTLVLFGNLEWF